MRFNMRPEICRKGSISKRSDGYWLGTIYYLNEYGQRKRKAFGGKLKKCGAKNDRLHCRIQ